LFIDLHLIHETTSPQAFLLLREKNRNVRRPDLTFVTMDHSVLTGIKVRNNIKGIFADKQTEFLIENCKKFGIAVYDLNHPDNDIVHIIESELGLTMPGKTIGRGDSHTSTHGAFGILAFGISLIEITHVLATKPFHKKPKAMNIQIEGSIPQHVTTKYIIFKIIRQIVINDCIGYVVEFTGSSIKKYQCNNK